MTLALPPPFSQAAVLPFSIVSLLCLSTIWGSHASEYEDGQFLPVYTAQHPRRVIFTHHCENLKSNLVAKIIHWMKTVCNVNICKLKMKFPLFSM
jgi:hypothetical protein